MKIDWAKPPVKPLKTKFVKPTAVTTVEYLYALNLLNRCICSYCKQRQRNWRRNRQRQQKRQKPNRINQTNPLNRKSQQNRRNQLMSPLLSRSTMWLTSRAISTIRKITITTRMMPIMRTPMVIINTLTITKSPFKYQLAHRNKPSLTRWWRTWTWRCERRNRQKFNRVGQHLINHWSSVFLFSHWLVQSKSARLCAALLHAPIWDALKRTHRVSRSLLAKVSRTWTIDLKLNALTRLPLNDTKPYVNLASVKRMLI